MTDICRKEQLIMKTLIKIALLVAVVISCNRELTTREQVLFRSGVTDTIPYRIPTIAKMHNGDILALTDYRLCCKDIVYGRVDIHGRVSRDGGRSWIEEFVLI